MHKLFESFLEKSDFDALGRKDKYRPHRNP